MTDPTPAKLRELLLNEFTEDDLKALCASIDIEYDKLSGTGTFGKTRSLLDKVQSQDKLRNLQAKVRELRPAAYEAAGFTSQPETDTSPATTASATRQTSETSQSQLPIGRWIALALIILLCFVAGLALLIPRLQNANQATSPSTNAATQTAPATISAVATETPPAIVEGTDAMDKGAGTLIDATPSTEQNVLATATSLAPTALPLTGTESAAGIIITVTATSTPAGTTIPVTPTTGTTNTHPATSAIRELNDQLPRFYKGEVDIQAIQQYWMGEALRSVTAFGLVRLPRAMRIQPSQRSTLATAYEYRKEPALVRETKDGAIVSSREYWRYSTSANASQICEVRDYVYNLVRIDGQYKVSQFNSRLVDSGC